MVKISLLLCIFISTFLVGYGDSFKLQRQLEVQGKEEYIQKQILNFKNKNRSVVENSDVTEENIEGQQTYIFNKIYVEGVYSYRNQFAKLVKKYENRPLTGNEISNLSIIFTNFFKNKGDFGTFVKFQSGNIVEGILKFEVIPGKLKEIIFNDSKGENSHYLRRNLAFPVGQNDILNIYDIDQGLDNLNVGNYTHEIGILPIEEGQYNLIINEKTSGFGGAIGFDNNSYKDLGRNRGLFVLQKGNLLGLNDLWTFNFVERLMEDRKKNKENIFNIGVKIPYGYWKFGYEIEKGYNRNILRTSLNSYKMKNSVLEQRFYIEKMIWRNNHQKTSLVSSFKVRDYESKLNDIKLEVSSKQYGSFSFGVEHLNFIKGGVFYMLLEYERGVPWFHSEKNQSPRRHGAYEIEYNKVNFSFNWQKYINMNKYTFLYNLSSGGIYSPDRLLTMNQFSIGDLYTVRGFKETSVYGNKAIFVNNTLTYVNDSMVEPFIGFDGGISRDRDLPKNDKLGGLALGINLKYKNMRGSIAYGIPVKVPTGLPREKNPIYVNFYYNF